MTDGAETPRDAPRHWSRHLHLRPSFLLALGTGLCAEPARIPPHRGNDRYNSTM